MRVSDLVRCPARQEDGMIIVIEDDGYIKVKWDNDDVTEVHPDTVFHFRNAYYNGV